MPPSFARRSALALCALVLASLSAHALAAFGFEDVAQRARALAQSPYRKPDAALPKDLQSLTYDQHRDIRFRPQRAWWRGEKLPFELMFFHLGYVFDSPVRVNEVVGSSVREIRFSPDLFDYGANAIDLTKLRNIGFAGFRVHYAVNSPRYKDEVMVFLGASYFRALGKGQRYGISARGLAVDTALASGEEFPRFTEFWIERPAPNARELRIYALLDSPRTTGAYAFVLRPGLDTIVDVQGRIFLRQNVTKLGIAPLTTMFLHGENQRALSDDFRPEVHDSDGLSIHSGTGEWIWRPLANPRRLLVTSFAMSNPLGFGLQQRDRSFSHYEDLEARYELRPSVWIEPKGKWGAGRVELVQIPTPDETNDNIVAYWVPDHPPAPGSGYDFSYRMLWQRDDDVRPPLAYVTQSRRGHGYQRKVDDSIQYVLDFDGPALHRIPFDVPIEGVVTVDGNAELIETNVFRHEVTGGVRLTLRIKRLDERKPVEMRAFLRNQADTLSETWSYVLPPT